MRYRAMTDKRIEVITYSGYRGEERPKAFFLHDTRIEVMEILNMWIEEEIDKKARRRIFKVRGSDRNIHEIYCDEKTLEWLYKE
jgi:hypothetical protein